MARKQSKVTRKTLFTWFMLTGLIFLFAPQNLTSRLQSDFNHVFHWPLSIGRSLSLSMNTQPKNAGVVDRREYNKIQNHLANVTEQLNEAQKKIAQLSGLYNRSALEGAVILPADVIRASINNTQSEYIINRGQNDGLDKGQFVLGLNNIIGIISEVYCRTARVTLVTDPQSNLEAKIGELKTVIKGCGNNLANIHLIPTKHKINTGDAVYACKKPGFLDSAMIIGKVKQCREDSENPLLWDITVEAGCDIERLDSVAVLIMNPEK
jgi:cell shape-determining protein MreC